MKPDWKDASEWNGVFRAGDKGVTCGGNSYEVIENDGSDCYPLKVLHSRSDKSLMLWHHADGRVNIFEGAYDLLPPDRIKGAQA